ncbi:38309_t:CDS:2, partial [Gigaspora margarita]
MKDCQASIKDGLADIVAIMKLEQVVGKLKRYEKARIENNFIDTAERLEREGKQYEKEIELAKYHEERGKKGCECYSCKEQKKIKAEVEAEREKIIDEYETEQKKSGELKGETERVKAECYNCGEYKKVDSDRGL